LIFYCFAPAHLRAQTKRRFPLAASRGEAGPAVAGRVSGTLAGAAHRDYFFYIPRGRSADISLSTDRGESVRFDVISPKGKKLFQNEAEILDELPQKGTYVIRVYRAKDKAGKPGTSAFQLSIFMYI
jgi:hypothetical protein